MNTDELIKVLKKYKFTRRQFCGVIPINHLPLKKIRRPCSFIINTDHSSLPGQHWFAIYLPRRGKIEYFDSYGLKPLNPEIYDFIRINGNNWIYNNQRIQDYESKSCGQFCALYIAFRSKGLSRKYFLSLFISDKIHNEKLVNTMFSKLYKRISKK
jgi:hypothetical protein